MDIYKKQSFAETTLEITDASELVDEDDVDIQILTKGTATVTSNQINIVLRLGSNAIQNIE